MWNSLAKWDRLKNALRMRKIDPTAIDLDALCRVLTKRGISDRDLNDIVWSLINILEPPACPMTHCKAYGHSTAPMNCRIGRLPGHCKDLRAYRQRKAARESAKRSPAPCPTDAHAGDEESRL